MDDIRESKEYKKLERALKKNLKDRGRVSLGDKELLQEYMDCWANRRRLQEDIDRRGVLVPDSRGGETENRSMSLRIQASRQMLSLWDKLGFKAEDLAGENDEL